MFSYIRLVNNVRILRRRQNKNIHSLLAPINICLDTYIIICAKYYELRSCCRGNHPSRVWWWSGVAALREFFHTRVFFSLVRFYEKGDGRAGSERGKDCGEVSQPTGVSRAALVTLSHREQATCTSRGQRLTASHRREVSRDSGPPE